MHRYHCAVADRIVCFLSSARWGIIFNNLKPRGTKEGFFLYLELMLFPSGILKEVVILLTPSAVQISGSTKFKMLSVILATCFQASMCPHPPLPQGASRRVGQGKRRIRPHNGDVPGGAVVKNPPANAGDTGLSPGPGRSHMPQSS